MGSPVRHSGITELELSIPSMMCDGCAEKIQNTLEAISGVRNVKAKLWRKRVRVRYDLSKLTKEQIRDALEAAGFATAEV